MTDNNEFDAKLPVDVSIPAAKVGDDASRSQGLHDTAGIPLLATGLKPPSAASSSASLDDGDAVKDPWIVTELRDTSPRWSDLTPFGKLYRFCVQWIGKALALLVLLYFFICSLDFLSSAFRLLGGRAAGSAFTDNSLLQNPIAGLMIGVLATVLVQSSSTSTSIVVTMVASGILKVPTAIPVIMGANIGTSVTNTIVSLAQCSDRDEFRRAFGGATIHDMFNWLSVGVFLPLEVLTGYMYHITNAIVNSLQLETGIHGANKDMLQRLTKPFTEIIIQLDKKVIEGVAFGDPAYAEKSMIKEWCSHETRLMRINVTDLVNITTEFNTSMSFNVTELKDVNVSVPMKPCIFLFHNTGMRDSVIGAILLVSSLVILCSCLVLMVKLLNSALRSSMLILVKRVINADLPGCFAYFTGYLAMLVGAALTIVVQSSSVFTSALTPLVGIGMIRIERMYPLTLGSNVGTTTTGLLAAMTASNDQLKPALQIALCHLCFNISGILLWYPIPCLRLPIVLAKAMGNTTARYRWFAVFYVIVMFFLLPLSIFVLSMAGHVVFLVVISAASALLLFVIVMNILQKKRKQWLPLKLQTWEFLPFEWMHSLDPLDRLIDRVTTKFRAICCRCCPRKNKPTQLPLIHVSPKHDDRNGTSAHSGVFDMTYYHAVPSCASLASSIRTECTNLEYESGSNTPAVGTPSHSVVNTPSHSPCVSRLPSFIAIPEAVLEELEELEHANEQ